MKIENQSILSSLLSLLNLEGHNENIEIPPKNSLWSWQGASFQYKVLTYKKRCYFIK